MQVSADVLGTITRRIFEAAGSAPAEAMKVAHRLVEANLAGHDSHGVIRVHQYVEAITGGWLHPHTGGVPMLDEVLVSLDQWDGYTAERAGLADALVDVDNLVVVTGDLHSFIAGVWRTRDGRDVATCLMVGSVSSANLAEMIAGRTLPSVPLPLTRLVRGANPHLAYVNSSAHGYNVLDITPDRLRCDMVAVSGVRAPFALRWPLHSVEVPAVDR